MHKVYSTIPCSEMTYEIFLIPNQCTDALVRLYTEKQQKHALHASTNFRGVFLILLRQQIRGIVRKPMTSTTYSASNTLISILVEKGQC